MKKIILAVFGLLIVIGALVLVKGAQFSTLVAMQESFVEPPMSVSSFAVKADKWEDKLSAISSLEAAKGLLITADLAGRISKIHFDAGSEVKAGDLLVEQDTSSERAQLRSAQASASLAKNNLSRISALYKKQVVSKSELDNAKSQYQSAIADVDNIRSIIEKKSIRAPFDGRLGIRLVNLGQTINAGESLVSLQATNKMFANFFLPQQMLSKVSVGLPIRLSSDAVPGKVFDGAINAIDPEIDTATRSIKLQAILSNDSQELLPGMFARVEVILPETKDVLLIPITAIQYAAFGDSVFVLETADKADKEKAKTASIETGTTEGLKTGDSKLNANNGQAEPLISRQQFVQLGEHRGDFVAVAKGLNEGQLVASTGAFKLRNNGPIVINNSVLPEFNVSPQVEDK